MLGECHAHVIMDGINYREAVALHKNGAAESVIRKCFEKYRAAEITFIRDGGDHLGVSRRAAELAADYGITYLTPVYAIHKKGHYGGIVGKGFADMTEYADLVRGVRAEGGDFIKIMVSGLLDFNEYGRLTEEGLDPAEIREMVHIAHEEGMAVMAHCNGARTMEAAALAGTDSIEHGAYADEAALQTMVEAGCIWTPTVSPVGNLKGGGRFSDEVTEKITREHLRRVSRYVQLGGRIALGSDAGAWRVPHVEGLHTELDFLRGIVSEEHLMQTEALLRRKFGGERKKQS